MKIIITAEGEHQTENLILTDEEINNDNFVEVVVGKDTLLVPIEELYAAAGMFYELRRRRLEQESIIGTEE